MATGDVYADGFRRTSDGALYVTFDGSVIPSLPGLTLTGLFTEAAEDSITAHAGGGKASATALSATKNLHRISVCATAADSVLMPPALAGQAHFVRNAGAAAAQVFGQGTDTINSIATGTGVSLPTPQGAWFVCTTSGNWSTDVGVGPITGTTVTATTGVVVPLGAQNATTVQIGVTAGTGLYSRAATTVDIAVQSVDKYSFTNAASAGFVIANDLPLNWSTTNVASGSTATSLSRISDGVVGVGTGAAGSTAGTLQLTGFNSFGLNTSATVYSRVSILHATTTLASVSGATVTATNLIPAKAKVLGVNTRVQVALGTGSGTTGYTVGDGSDADRWGSVTGTATTTDTDQNDATADPSGYFNAANNVVITAAGGNFDGTGSIFIDVSYTFTEAE